MHARLEQQAGELVGRSVFFHGHHPGDVAMASVGAADASLVTLAPGVIGMAYPSKLINSLEAGTPVIAMVERHSEMATMVERERVGLVVQPGDEAGLAAAIEGLLDLPDDERTAMRERSRRLAREEFGRDRYVARWADLLDELERDRP